MSEGALEAALDSANFAENNQGDITGQDSDSSATTQPAQSQTTQSENGHPAWSGLLDTLPEGLHETVKPFLRDWDNGVKSLVQKVHSEYEPYKPIIEAGYQPEQLEQAMAVYTLINENPQALYDQMREFYKFGSEQGQETQQTNQPQGTDPEGYDEPVGTQSEFDITQHPQFQAMQQQLEALTGGLQQQFEAQLAQEADESVDQQIKGLYQQYGFDPNDPTAEQFAIGLALAGSTLEEGFKRYADMVGQSQARQTAANAPRILPAGGGVPSNRVNPAELNEQDTNKLLIGLLEQANRGE